MTTSGGLEAAPATSGLFEHRFADGWPNDVQRYPNLKKKTPSPSRLFNEMVKRQS